MHRIEETAAQSVKGSFTLLIGNYISLIVNAAGTILVALMLSPAEYGLFTITLVLPSLFSLFTNWGIDQALINFIARYRSQKKQDEINSLIRTGYAFKIALGVLLSIALYLSAEFLTTVVLKRPEVSEYVRIASIYIFSSTIYNITISILTGFEKMDNRALLTIIQAIIKGTLSPALVYIGYGVTGVVIGHVASYFAAAFTGLIVVILMTRTLPRKQDSTTSPNTLRLLLGYGLPISLGTILTGLANQFNGFLLSWFIVDEIIGNYSVAVRFVSLVSVVSASIVTTFLPAFSKYDVNHERKITEDIYQGSVRYSTIFLIPFTCLMITLSGPGISTLFGAKYPYAPLYLSLLMIPHLLVGTGSLSINQFLNSQRETRATMAIQSISSITKMIFSLFFIRIWGVTGLLLGLITSDTVRNLIGLYVLNGKYGIKPKMGHTLRTLLCSGISSGISLGFQRLIPIEQPFLKLAINASIFMISTLLLAPFLGVLEKKDIQNLNSMFKNIPLLYPLANIILNLELRLLNM